MSREDRIKETLWGIYKKTEPGSKEAIALLDAYLFYDLFDGSYKPRHVTKEGMEVYTGEPNL